MNISVLFLLVQTTIATTIAILLVALFRKPLAHFAGARVAYWLWLLVPTSNVVALLPAPVQSVTLAPEIVPRMVTAMLPLVATATPTSHQGPRYPIGLIVWIVGVLLMLAFMLYRQRAFIRSLGQTTVAPDGTHRSGGIRGPVLVGLWKPRIVLPTDFETLYPPDERELVIAHERAHQRRLDIPLNAVAAVWLCCSWFNPFMYWAIARFRSDQELACDAVVLAEAQTTRRRYSEALLKAQLAEDSMLTLPAICNWGSRHPLKERIVMMNRPLPSRERRLSGIALTSALIVAGGFAVWSTAPTISHAQAPLQSSDTAPQALRSFCTAGPVCARARGAFCEPFVIYARDLLAFAERDAQGAASHDEMRRVAQATFDCAASGVRLWSRLEADARLTEIEGQFQVGTNTSVAVSAARVAIAKADYCEAEFTHLAGMTEMYRKRNAVGLVGTDNIAPVLAELVALVPVCGRSP